MGHWWSHSHQQPSMEKHTIILMVLQQPNKEKLSITPMVLQQPNMEIHTMTQRVPQQPNMGIHTITVIKRKPNHTFCMIHQRKRQRKRIVFSLPVIKIINTYSIQLNGLI